MGENFFFDIHCHAMNLSHPNLFAFIKRSPLHLLGMAVPFLDQIFSIVSRHRALNLFVVMEHEVGGIFLITEHFLKKKGVVQNETLGIDGTTYEAIVLTPLLIDFDYRKISSKVYYNVPPEKPVLEQILDVFNGIKKYCEFELVETSPGHYATRDRQSKAIFEIYPFLGINTGHYTLPELEQILEKYFGGYSGSHEDLRANLGKFNGDIESLGSNFFAGIKVYPPLGFDPWPETDAAELQKVECLYKYCLDKNIPLTSHCSQIGFNLDEKADSYTSPKRWRQVLQHYQNLKLNLAHLGEQKKILFIFENRQWEEEIFGLIQDYPNVYTDISFRAFNDDYYRHLKGAIGSGNKLPERVLFGSDFMINLLMIDSYNDYINLFKNTQQLTSSEKEFICSTNPGRFLFG